MKGAGDSMKLFPAPVAALKTQFCVLTHDIGSMVGVFHCGGYQSPFWRPIYEES